MRKGVVATGDAAIVIVFAALGRSSHGEMAGGPVLGTIGVALPFLAGWFLAAWTLRAYSPKAFSSVPAAVRAVAWTWLIGCAIALAIRSVIEWHWPPAAFVAIAFGFNLVFLCAWHGLLARLFPPTMATCRRRPRLSIRRGARR